MSDSTQSRTNVGAYDQPFSGVGIEYYPLGVKPGRSGLTLHESGYLSRVFKKITGEAPAGFRRKHRIP
jgi:hypothetical protein